MLKVYAMDDELELSKKWFKNLRVLDSENKLKHGKSLANNQFVKDFEIKQNKVTANIQQTPKKRNRVRMEFKKLSTRDKGKLNKIIKNNSNLQDSLMMNIFPNELFESGIKIIPDSMDDFKISCNCKSEEIFCKHKAALIHYLSNKIHDNPFLLFTLRDFHYEKVIDNKEKTIKKIDEVLEFKNEKIRKTKKADDYDEIPLLINNFKLLDKKTEFFPSATISFKDMLMDILREYAILIQKVNNKFNKRSVYKHYITIGKSFKLDYPDLEMIFQKKWGYPHKWKEFHVNINGNYDITNFDTGLNINFKLRNLKHALFALFAEFQFAEIENYNDNLKFFYEIFEITTMLISKNALVPEFFELKNKDNCIRWVSATSDDTVVGIINDLAIRCPDDLITYNGNVLDKKEQINCAISLFFNGFAYYVNYNSDSKLIKGIKTNKQFELFFLKSQSLENDEKNIINKWLYPLGFVDENYEFNMDIVQENGRFLIDFNVDINNETRNLKDVLETKEYPIVNRDSKKIVEIFNRYGWRADLNEKMIVNITDILFLNGNMIKTFEKNGIKVNMPDEIGITRRAKLSLVADKKIMDKASLTLDDLDKFDWKIAVGDETFSLNEFKNLTHEYNDLVKINNRYIRINTEDLKNINHQTDFLPANPSQNDLMHFILSGNIENLDIGVNDKLSELFDDLFSYEEIKIPELLNGELRNYQKIGFSWLYQNMKIGFGSILADDMGLGKTIQVLAAILYLKENNLVKGDILVISPTSLLGNWQKEIEKFAPTLTSFIYHGPNRTLPEETDIIITSYGILQRDFDILEKNLNIFLCVVDEAQNIKNPNTKQTRAVKKLDSRHRIALTGTPIENRLSEYWSIFDFTNRGYLFSLRTFNEKYANPIEKHNDEFSLDVFKKITSPFILRRNKTDKEIINDLPDKIVNDVYCNLTVEQAAMYEETLNVVLRDVENSEGINRKGLILKLLTSLKQICNHPAHFSKSDKISVNESGKTEVLISILDNILENNEKCIIFTQYVEMGNILQKLIEKHFNEEVLFFNGSLSRKKREEMIDKFQNNDENKIMILSLKAGGTGLNLTAAQNVIHYDLWWNPAVENQATDRAYRIGQENNVMVYRFITTGTFEEHVNNILIEKSKLAEIAIEDNEMFITEMSNDELKNILKLRRLN